MMKYIKTEEAAGHVLCHDITQIIPGRFKGTAFRKGHIVTAEDIPVLLSLGKENLYVWERKEGILHEDEAAYLLADLCLGDGLVISGQPREGKIEIKAAADGLLKVDDKKLRAVNGLGEMMIATRHGNFPVKKGQTAGAMRVIPLVIEEEKMKQARQVCRDLGGDPILKLMPMGKPRTAVVVTGSEVAKGRIEDAFGPAVEAKLKEYDVPVMSRQIVSDDMESIIRAIRKAADDGAEMILCTGGMSVDPDDRTPGAIKSLGAEIVTYGAPVLPGAMFLLAYYNADGDRGRHGGHAAADVSPADGAARRIPVMGLPGCVMYSRRTIFDLILPRVLAGDNIDDIAGYGQGGLCLNCETCVFPDCGFGK